MVPSGDAMVSGDGFGDGEDPAAASAQRVTHNSPRSAARFGQVGIEANRTSAWEVPSSSLRSVPASVQGRLRARITRRSINCADVELRCSLRLRCGSVVGQYGASAQRPC
jgi:hypothetical protein